MELGNSTTLACNFSAPRRAFFQYLPNFMRFDVPGCNSSSYISHHIPKHLAVCPAFFALISRGPWAALITQQCLFSIINHAKPLCLLPVLSTLAASHDHLASSHLRRWPLHGWPHSHWISQALWHIRSLCACHADH